MMMSMMKMVDQMMNFPKWKSKENLKFWMEPKQLNLFSINPLDQLFSKWGSRLLGDHNFILGGGLLSGKAGFCHLVIWH